MIKDGVSVTLHGLKRRTDLNGRVCTVVHYNEARRRWRVDIGEAKDVMLDPANLRVIAEMPAAPAVAPPAPAAKIPAADPAEAASSIEEPAAATADSAEGKAAATSSSPQSVMPVLSAPPAVPPPLLVVMRALGCASCVS